MQLYTPITGHAGAPTSLPLSSVHRLPLPSVAGVSGRNQLALIAPGLAFPSLKRLEYVSPYMDMIDEIHRSSPLRRLARVLKDMQEHRGFAGMPYILLYQAKCFTRPEKVFEKFGVDVRVSLPWIVRPTDAADWDSWVSEADSLQLEALTGPRTGPKRVH